MYLKKRAISMIAFLGIALFLLLEISCGVDQSNSASEFEAPFVVVLGIAQDAGYPQLNCKKECCAQVWSGQRSEESVSCLGIADPANNQYWLIDATPSIVEQCQRMEKLMPGAMLAGIFLTHAHIGHYTGLMMLGREAMGATAIPTFVMPGMKVFLEENGPWSQLIKLKNIELFPLHADSTLAITSQLNVQAIPVPHRDEFSETVGFKIIGADKKVLFIPDIDKWDKWNRDINNEILSVDYALLDGTFYQAGEIPGRDMNEIPHPFIEESMRYFDKLSVDQRAKIFFIHLNHTNPLLWSPSHINQFEQSDFKLAKTGQIIPI